MLFILAAGPMLNATQVFGNSNSLPISLVLSLSQTIRGLHWDKIPGDNDNEVAARGILYLLIFQQLGQLVRWSWGYNVLLAPPDKINGTSEHAISRLEDGQVRLGEDRPLMRDMSVSDEDDEENTSDSDDTRVGFGKSGRESLIESQNEQLCQSGQQTPVIHRQHAASVSSNTSDSSRVKHAPTTELFPTPADGNIKPSTYGVASSSSDMGKETYLKGSKAFRILRTWLLRFKTMNETVIGKASHAVHSAARRTFLALPPSAQKVLRSTGSTVWKILLGIWSFMNPPLWAMLAAIVVASVPDLQRFFFADGTFFKNSVTSAIRQSGGVAVPLILVVLGANLARNTLPSSNHSAEDDREETKLLIAALISRMLLPTVIMAPLLAVTAKYVPISILDDPIFVIVCFLITGAPSALQLAQICQINNVYMGAMARLLFQSYVVWILPSTLVLVMCALEVVEWAQ